MDPVLLAKHSPKHFIPVFDANLEGYIEALDRPTWIYDGIRAKHVWINTAGLKPWGKKTKKNL